MKIEFNKLLAATAAAAALVAATVAVAADPPLAAKTMTVYVSGTFGKRNVARGINEMHAQMEKDGWQFADLEAQLENGDTEGVWLTYTRP